jgi:hypothetical protein
VTNHPPSSDSTYMENGGHTSPHRSNRSLPISIAQIAGASVAAASICAAVLMLGSSILSGHNWLCSAILRWANVTIVGLQPANLYRAGLLTVDGFLIEASTGGLASPHQLAAATALIVFVAALVGWRRPFLRGLAVSVVVVIVVAAGATLFSPRTSWSTAHFSRLWLRVELAVWLTAPWLAASTMVFRTGVGPRLISAIAALELYLICWSAIRMAAGIALVAAVGAGAVPVVFFLVGPICDLLSVMVFYSLALR